MPTNFDYLLTDEHIADFTDQGLWKNRLLIDYFDETAEAHPDRLCNVEPAGRHTYSELAEDIDVAAHALVDAGVQPTDVIGIQLPNWYEWLIIHLAAMRVGAITNPLIPIYRDKEIGHMAKTARVSVLFIPEDFRHFNYVDMVERLRDDLPDLRRTVTVRSQNEHRHCVRFEDFLDAGRARRDADPVDFAPLRPDPNALALIMFTSGTTGKPKGVMHTHNNVLAGAMPWPDKLGMDETSVIHMASTLGHLTGYLFGASLPLMLGGTGVFQDVWNVDYFVYLIEKYGINHTSGSATFLHDLLAADNLDHYDLSSLKHFCCMGAPIPRSFVTTAKEKLPEMRVFGGWGMTECCLSTLGHPSYPEEKIVNTDGFPLPGMEIRTVDDEGAELPAGQEGRLQVKGAFLFHGYLGMLEETLEEFDGDWFDTGDIAVIDAEGFLTIAGRSKDVIIRGGENVPVAALEDALVQHPDVRDVAVVGMPDARLQEIAAAVVVTAEDHPPLTMESMQEYLQTTSIAKQYWPEYLEVRDALPKTPSGKPQKYILRDQLAETAEQNVREKDAGPVAAPGQVTAPPVLTSKNGSWWGPVDITRLDDLFSLEEKSVALTARKFVDREVRPNVADWFRDGRIPREIFPALGRLGAFGMSLKGFDCPGRSAVESGLVAQELEAGDSAVRGIVTVQGSLTMSAIHRHGSLDQKLEWLPRLASGDAVGCFALTETGAGSDPASMRTTARHEPGGDWVLDGVKNWVSLADIADVAIVWAQTEEHGNGRGIRGFVVPTDTPGFSVRVQEPGLSMRASVQCEVTLTDVRVPQTAMLPLDSAVGLTGPFQCLDEARYAVVWGTAGAARDCFTSALEHTHHRSQFGTPLTSFQLTQAKLADMAVDVNTAYRTAVHIGRMKDGTGSTPEMIAAGKLENTRIALRTASTARSMLGAVGVTLDYSPMRHAANLESVRTYDGTDEVQQLMLGRAITGVNAFTASSATPATQGGSPS